MWGFYTFATRLDLFRRFYGNLAAHRRAKHMDLMLVEAFRDMDPCPLDIECQCGKTSADDAGLRTIWVRDT